MTIDYGKLKVSDIKQMLVDEGFYSVEKIEKLNIKGKNDWVELHKNVHKINEEKEVDNLRTELDDIISDMGEGDFSFGSGGVEPEMLSTTPQMSDPDWHDYLMDQFVKGELIDNKYPNVNALRRLVELMLGPIVFSGPIETKTTMDPNSVGKAVVTYELTIECETGPKTFRSVASSHVGNTDDIFAVFPESIAETRAEGRALRRALRLGVVCADELTKKDTSEFVKNNNQAATTGEWDENDMITDQQINSINILCKRLSINLNNFINSGSKTYKDIQEVSRKTAASMIKRLNQYQSSGDDSVEIPLDILEN